MLNRDDDDDNDPDYVHDHDHDHDDDDDDDDDDDHDQVYPYGHILKDSGQCVNFWPSHRYFLQLSDHDHRS